MKEVLPEPTYSADSSAFVTRQTSVSDQRGIGTHPTRQGCVIQNASTLQIENDPSAALSIPNWLPCWKLKYCNYLMVGSTLKCCNIRFDSGGRWFLSKHLHSCTPVLSCAGCVQIFQCVLLQRLSLNFVFSSYLSLVAVEPQKSALKVRTTFLWKGHFA